MRTLFLLFTLFCLNQSTAQGRYTPKFPELFKTIPLKKDNDPKWVQALYSSEPNIIEINKAFKVYFKEKPSEKTVLSQNYVYFFRQIQSLGYEIDRNGMLSNPNQGKNYVPEKYKEGDRVKKIGSSKKYEENKFVSTWHTSQEGDWKRIESPNKTRQTNIFSLYVFQDLLKMVAYTEGGGVYLSENGGEKWTNITPKEKPRGYFNSSLITITADEANNTIYFSFGGGIYYTTDNGNSWSFIELEEFGAITKINFNNDKLYFSKIGDTGPNSGLYVLDNDYNAKKLFSGAIWDFQIPEETNIIYLTSQEEFYANNTFYKSTDAGETFVKKPNGWPITDNGSKINFYGTKLAFSKSDPTIVYAALLGDVNDNTNDAGWLGVFKSIDGGETWTNTNQNNQIGGPYTDVNRCIVCKLYKDDSDYFQGWYDFDLEVSESNPDLVWVGGIKLFQTNDGGEKWRPVFSGHDDIQDITNVKNKVFVASDGGINEYTYQVTTSQVFSNTSSKVIEIPVNESFSANTINIEVLEQNPIKSIEISLDISHPNLDKLSASIRSPDGERFILFYKGDLKGGQLKATFTSNENQSQYINQWKQPYGGEYIVNFLKEVNGKNVSGNWHLNLENFDKTAGGTINSFSINLNTSKEYVPENSEVANDVLETKIINNGIHDSEFVGFGIGTSKLIMVGGTWHNGNKGMNENYETGLAQRLFGSEEPTGYVNKGDNNIIGLSLSYFSDSYNLLRMSDSIEIKPTLKTNSFGNRTGPNESVFSEDNSDLETHPTYFNRVYFGRHNKLFMSNDFGKKSNEIYSFGDEEDNSGYTNSFNYSLGNIVTDVKIAKNKPNHLFIVKRNNYSTSLVEGGTSYVYKSSDNGVSWNKLSLPFSDFNGVLRIDINDQDMLFVSSSEHQVVYYSDDYGATFNLLYDLDDQIEPVGLVALDGTEKVIVHGYKPSTNEQRNYSGEKLTSNKIYLISKNSIEDLTNNALPAYVSIKKLDYFYGNGKIYFASNAGVWESSMPIESEDNFVYPLVEKEHYFTDETIVVSSYTNINRDLIDHFEWIIEGKSFSSENYLLKVSASEMPNKNELDLQLKIHLKDGSFIESDSIESAISIEILKTIESLENIETILFKNNMPIGVIELNNCEPIPLGSDYAYNILVAKDLKTNTLGLADNSVFQDELTNELSGSDNIELIESFISNHKAKVLLLSTGRGSLRDWNKNVIWDHLSEKGMSFTESISDYSNDYELNWPPPSLDAYDVIILDIREKIPPTILIQITDFIKNPEKKTIIVGPDLTDILDIKSLNEKTYPVNDVFTAANMFFQGLEDGSAPENPTVFYPYTLRETTLDKNKACLDLNRDGILDKSSPEDLDGDGVLNEFDECPNTIEGTMVDFKGCEIFSLPANNYMIKNLASSCVGSNNGSLSIQASNNTYDYILEVQELNASYNINAENGHELLLDELNAGLYTLVFKVVGEDAYSQVFEARITEPAPLQAKTNFDLNGKSGFLALAGAETYFIEINGRISTVSDNRFNLDLKPGLNTIKVSTPLDCQGIFEKEIFISESLTYYPNPVIDVLNVIIPGKDELVGVQVYTDAGMKVLDKKEEVSFDRSILLNLNRLKSGVYIININGKTVAKEFKIIKK